MNREQTRDMLRRRLQETTAAQWTDATLNLYINMGLRFMHRRIQEKEPSAIIYTFVANTVASLGKYRKPSALQYENSFKVKFSSSGNYIECDLVTMDDIDSYDGGTLTDASTTNPIYAHDGDYYEVRPKPSSAVTKGLKVKGPPILSVSADADVPDIRVDFHEGVVYKAEALALADTAEEPINALRDLQEIVADINNNYVKSGKKVYVSLSKMTDGRHL